MGEDGRRHHLVADVAGLAENVVHHVEALELSSMGQHALSVDITDGIDARDVGLEVVVHLNAALGEVDACPFQAQPLDVGLTSGGDEDEVGLYGLLLTLTLEGHGIAADSLHASLHIELHAPFADLLAQPLGDVAVERRQAFLQELHHRHLRAEAAEGRCKLHSDDACSDDAQPLGHLLDIEQLGRRDDIRLVDAWYGNHLRTRTRGDDDVLCFILLAVAHHRPRVLQLGMSFNVGDAGHLHQRIHTAPERLHDTLLALGNLLEVNLVRQFVQSIFLTLAQAVDDLSIAAQSLRGDTSAVETGAAGILVFKHRHAESVLCCMFGRAVTAGACTDDNQICFRHFFRYYLLIVHSRCKSNQLFSFFQFSAPLFSLFSTRMINNDPRARLCRFYKV